MASSKELRRRIKSIKNTSQITKAMQMVSATKMRKAQNQTLNARPYWQALLQALAKISKKIDSSLHPLLRSNGTKVGILVLSTDKGLCGSLNANIIRSLQNKMDTELKSEEAVFYTVGRRVRDYVVRTGKNLAADFENTEKVGFSESVKIRKVLLEDFFAGKINKVYITYPRFVSTFHQEARFIQLLPIDPEALMLMLPEDSQIKDEDFKSEFLFEPNVDQVLDYALVHLIDTRIYQALLETKASEHSARMIAMKNATDNAKELVNDLTLAYNQLRQDAITRELLEITSAGAALN